MTEKEYRLVCLLIDKNTEEYHPNYCAGTYRRMYEDNIAALKQDLKTLVDKGDEE